MTTEKSLSSTPIKLHNRKSRVSPMKETGSNISGPGKSSRRYVQSLLIGSSSSTTVKVKSTTVQGSRNHPRENVKANIVRGNIPVANGVVHLIDKPLIIVASPLWDYLQEEVTTMQCADL